MNDIRSILTDEEIEEIKTRVVDGLINGVFLNEIVEIDKSTGVTFACRELNWKVKRLVRDTAMEILKEEIARIATEVIAPQTRAAAGNLMKRFVEQTRQIADKDKIDWYWEGIK